MNKYLLKQILVKILLLVLFYCPFAFTQISFIKYQSKLYRVPTNMLYFMVKEGYYYDELLKKLKGAPYFPTYSMDYMNNDFDGYYEKNRRILLNINGDVKEINILDHYLKFEKEEFVEKIFPYDPINSEIPNRQRDIKGHVFQNDQPLTNHIVNLFYLYPKDFDTLCYTSITDENGNYIFRKIYKGPVEYVISFKIGDNRYNISFVLEEESNEDKVINFNDGIIGINKPEEIPSDYSLSQNYPNPFNPTTTIQYSIPKDEHVKLTVYDITGKVVKELVNGYKTAGKYSIEFNASGYASGMYYYKIEAGEYKNIQKMMLVK